MPETYDVIVIGGGPAGSYTAFQLAREGYRVGLFEKKKKPGSDIICAGVIGIKAFRRFELPYDSILTKINSFTFVSPNNSLLEYSQEEPLAYTVDRGIFDRDLFEMARINGAETHLGDEYAVERIEESNQCCSVMTRHKRIFRAKFACIATGINYRLQAALGFGKPAQFLYGYQAEVPLMLPSLSRAFIHVGRDIAPGSFGWVFPIGPGTVRAGVLVEKKSEKWMRNLLARRVYDDAFSCSMLKAAPASVLLPAAQKEGSKTKDSRALYTADEGTGLKIMSKPIAYGSVKRTATRRVLAVGEAAGQVKTSTGGGVHFGLLCSEIAVDLITRALRGRAQSGVLDYETTWRSILIAELGIGMKLRKAAASIDDRQLEIMFTFAKRNKFWIQLLTPRIDFDYHSNMLSFCLETFKYVLKIKK
jgi:digeranylgeranylglycerophospholipid reductase